jgi:HEAT repeat protein
MGLIVPARQTRNPTMRHILSCGLCLVSLTVLLTLVTNGVTQAPDTFAQALTRHHIALANPALVEALRNPDKEVRGLAAWQLAETKDKDSLPQILQAVQSEKDARAIVNLASAAAHLGSSEGIAALEAVCHDSSVPDLVRSDAARHLFDQNNRACMPDLVGDEEEWQRSSPRIW